MKIVIPGHAAGSWVFREVSEGAENCVVFYARIHAFL
jgi:hypothetical protein